jgi:hypothetical protein
MVHRINFLGISTLEKSIESLDVADIDEICSKFNDGIDVLDLYIPTKYIEYKGVDRTSFFLNVMIVVYRLKTKDYCLSYRRSIK